MLGKESDLASRRALWQANYEVAELTGKVGKPEDALAAHRQVLAAREALAAETPADPEIKADVGRSLTAVAGLLEATGRTEEAEATYRKAETLLVELAPTIAEAAAARAVLADCRSRLGWLLHTTGRDDEALSVYRLARADQEALAAAPGATAESRRDLAATINGVAILLAATGKSSEAEAEYRKALAIQQKLADDNPAVTEFRSRPGTQPQQPRHPAVEYGQVVGGGGRVPQGAGDPTEAGRRQPRRHRIPQRPGEQPQQPRLCCRIRASHRKRRPSTARRWQSSRSWPTTTPPSPNFRGIWRTACSASVGSSRRPEKRTRRSATTRGKRRSGRSSPRPARQPPKTGIPWRTARPTRRTCSVGRGGSTRRSPHASAPWRCVSLWSRRIPSSRTTARASARRTCDSGRCDAT